MDKIVVQDKINCHKQVSEVLYSDLLKSYLNKTKLESKVAKLEEQVRREKLHLLIGVKIPRNKGRHCLFRKSQLDSRTFGMAGSMGLWTRYHSKCLVIVALKLKELKVSQLSI